MGPVSVYVITLREQAGDASPGVLALPKQECDEGQLGQLGGAATRAGRIPGFHHMLSVPFLSLAVTAASSPLTPRAAGTLQAKCHSGPQNSRGGVPRTKSSPAPCFCRERVRGPFAKYLAKVSSLGSHSYLKKQK